MSSKVQQRLTFTRLKSYLERIGFNRSLVLEATIAFHHEVSGVVVTVRVPEDGNTIRPADLESILIRLESHGLETQDGIQKLRQGQLPAAA